MSLRVHRKHLLTSWQYIALGYLIVILVGSLMLCFPFAAKGNVWTPYIDALFTATSATCVTGLVIYDTFLHWTVFGQIVILILIQVGGIGFMTIIALISMFLGRRIGIYQRRIIMESSGNLRASGLILLVKRILIGTAIIEGSGIVLLAIRFCQDFGFGQGLYFALFHSVSAFCNAGFDLLGILSEFSSVSHYASDPLIILTLSALIVLGGIGFIVWNDLIDKKFRVTKLGLHTKIVLLTTSILIVVPTALFLAFEHNHAFQGMDGGTMFLSALFQSIAPRTAGFFSVDPANLSDASCVLTMLLMFVGGSSGSTAGGIKTTTFIIICCSLIASMRNSQDINVGRRRVENAVARQAMAIVIFYLAAIFVAIIAICAIDGLPLRDVSFEVVSAIGTVGLSMGITAKLSVASKIITMLLMYAGRVGLLTLALAIGEKRKNPPLNRPLEKIMVG